MSRILRHRYGRARLTYQQKKRLPPSAFALERRGDLPLTDEAGQLDPLHVRNAAARLSMMRHLRHVTPSEYRHALGRIRAAGARLGVEISA
jgi:hypothetical protein